MISKSAQRRMHPGGNAPDRAVIDIGSNTVRLVVYSGSPRAPTVFLNEKVSARLGRDLGDNRRLPDDAIDTALAALARYATILPDLGLTNVQTVATAAVREAENGPEFLERVRALGLDPRLLSGEEEARGSAEGVIGAFSDARGTVADLGGGSLELVMIEDGRSHDGASLPLGTLRLPTLQEAGAADFTKSIERELARAGWATAHPGPLYMVGGTWRAFAVYAMRTARHPLTDPHGFRLSTDDAAEIAAEVARAKSADLATVRGLTSSRAVLLPDAAAMLGVMLDRLRPDGLVFSAWGLREGLLFSRLDETLRRQDPLLASIGHFTEPRGGSITLATMIAAWTADVVSNDGNGSERLRMAATMLALAAAQIEPNLRLRHATAWAMDKRWLGLDPAARALLTAALRAACGKPALRPELLRLADETALREAAGWGLAIRLCRRLGAGTRVSLLTSALQREDDRLVLWIDPSRAQLVSDTVTGDLKTLARWLGLDHELRIAERGEGAFV